MKNLLLLVPGLLLCGGASEIQRETFETLDSDELRDAPRLDGKRFTLHVEAAMRGHR